MSSAPASSAHGLMFHHFFGGTHPRGQGAISADQFDRVLAHYGSRILSAQEWTERALSGRLEPQHVCLTFDDALLCQVEIALPVLRRRGLTAFWFVYSSVLESNIEYLETFRYFRTVAFDSFEAFFSAFMAAAEVEHPKLVRAGLKDFVPEDYLAAYPFYSREDRIFRFMRDRVLGSERYESLMLSMMRKAGMEPAAVASLLWMKPEHLKGLVRDGHAIGLHSYSHPTCLSDLGRARQAEEYSRNHAHLLTVTGVSPIAVAHPCNSYNADTLDILSGLGVKLGFCSSLADVKDRSALECPREDHSNIVKELRLAA